MRCRSFRSHPRDRRRVLQLHAHRDLLGRVGVDITAHGHVAIGVLASVIAVIAVVVVVALAR
ncbi:MAG TPA: hypothetical protein VHW23_15770 [Kofleriaceae bacterium]|jgi:hypothetical protein|nr:hypothetical protein [Kofleriaceae bacterium]